MKDYYGVLGLTREAGEREIKAAYRKLAKQYHPDVVKGDKKKEERMYEIQEAYGCLGDPKQREQYDRKLEEQEQRKERKQKGMEAYHPKGEKGKKPEGAVNAEELFASFFGKIGR